MKWYSALTRLGLGGVACWFTYQAYREHQTRRNIESEIARIEEELVSISPPRSNEILVQIANPGKNFCSWLCYIPGGKHAKIVVEKENGRQELVMDFGVSPNFRRVPIQISVDASSEALNKMDLAPILWGPNAAEKILPMDPGFELRRRTFFVESEQDRKNIASLIEHLKSRNGIGIAQKNVQHILNKSLKNFQSEPCNPQSKVTIFRYSVERTIDEKSTENEYTVSVIAVEDE